MSSCSGVGIGSKAIGCVCGVFMVDGASGCVEACYGGEVGVVVIISVTGLHFCVKVDVWDFVTN